jgi:starch phosphorylase
MSNVHYYLPRDIDGASDLLDLALDLRWSWNHSADELWGQIDAELWTSTHNPWLVIQMASRQRLRELLADPTFRERVHQMQRRMVEYSVSPDWFRTSYPDTPLERIAYFSMEFMLSEALPIYSGGLGNVAGDQLKAASDLGVPAVGVGLLYQQGYFRQVIDGDGNQGALYPYNNPIQLPITPVRDEEGEWVRVAVPHPGRPLWARAWQVRVGRVQLLLLDTNDPTNAPARRGIAAELYGGGLETRLAQELILGIGGWRLLEELGLTPDVCHLNEGHPAFAVLERARSFGAAQGLSFDDALQATRAGNVFTTHTPVEAGFDRFPPDLVSRYLADYCRDELHVDPEEVLRLGRQHPRDTSEDFNMAYLALRAAGGVNGVSQLHGAVSRRLFRPLFPGWPEDEVPIGSVTNGIHVPSWDSREADDLWAAACGDDRWRHPQQWAPQMREVADEQIWQLRGESRARLVTHVRERYTQQLAVGGAPAEEVTAATHLFDPNTLTLGFARRFATYKRPNLLLWDPERLARLLADPHRPVQLVVAGKAHPADDAGKAMVRQWVEFSRRPDVRGRVVFLADYDMGVTEHLVQGVDVWLNTPRRPWEASGTSGMKTLVNGGLNLSVLDGWWAEAYRPEVGWAIGDGAEHGPEHDGADAEELYRILETEVVPTFYRRDAQGIPRAWVVTIRESMASLTATFSATRTVREYIEGYYLPAAAAYHRRVEADGAVAASLRDWRHAVDASWDRVRIVDAARVPVDGGGEFQVHAYLEDLPPEAVRVQVYAEETAAAPSEMATLAHEGPLVGSVNGHVFRSVVRTDRPLDDFTPRIVAHHTDALTPLEEAAIHWWR